MIYSVWQPSTHTYKYYEDSVGFSDQGPKPSVRGGVSIGSAPGEISWKLPSDAKAIGEGTEAKGVVVHPNAGGLNLSLSSIIGLSLVGYGLYRIFT